MIPATSAPAERPAASVDVRTETIFTLLRLPATGRPAPVWWTLAALAVIGWLGAAACLGAYRPNQISRVLNAVAPRQVLFYSALATAVAMAAGLAAMRRCELAGSALMIAAFLGGHLLYSWAYGLIRQFLPIGFNVPFGANADATGFLASRFTYAVALAGPMLLAWWIAYGLRGRRDSPDGWPGLNFRIGNFRAACRDVSATAKPMSAGRMLVTDYAVFCVILLAIMQLNVGFDPILRGTLWPLLPAVLLAAFANALAEEVIFRGLVQPAFIRGGGVAAGLWMQGLLFGLMHWGVSVGVLAALPVSLLIGLGSVIWGKIALDTRGLGWVVIAHAMVDVSVMGAFFVPRT
jgi:membrane protease YdiL (CAAX protease family)